MVMTKNPAKLEARAEGYEARGKPAKALKCRQKLARLTGMSPMDFQGGYAGQPQMMQGQMMQPQMMQGQMMQGQMMQPQMMQRQTLVAGGPVINAPFAWNTTNTPARYEANATKWERRGNYTKANKNRGKVWRLQNPQYATMNTVPNFYQNNQFVGYNVPIQQPMMMQQQPIVMQQPMMQGTQVETIVRPTIVEQTMRPERITEVQPIVHREIEQPQVRVIEKHMYETVPSAGPSTITNAPIVQETVRAKIIEEVQPVVHREVPAPFVERVEQHVTEHIVQPTVTTKQVINDGVQPAFVAAGGVPIQQQTTTTTTTTGQAGLMGKVQNALHHNNNRA